MAASGYMLMVGLILVGQYGTPNVSWLPLVLPVPLLPGPLFLWAEKLISRRSELWPWVQIPAVLVLMGGLLLWLRSLLFGGSIMILVAAIVLFGLLSRRHPRLNG